jgi:hypothetical protein
VRRWTDLVWLVLGSALLVLSALPVGAHSISATETSAFRLVNDLPSVPFAIVWLPMQLGNFLIVPAAVLVALALLAGRRVLALLALRIDDGSHRGAPNRRWEPTWRTTRPARRRRRRTKRAR